MFVSSLVVRQIKSLECKEQQAQRDEQQRPAESQIKATQPENELNERRFSAKPKERLSHIPSLQPCLA
jgi:hypothetical protein